MAAKKYLEHQHTDSEMRSLPSFHFWTDVWHDCQLLYTPLWNFFAHRSSLLYSRAAHSDTDFWSFFLDMVDFQEQNPNLSQASGLSLFLLTKKKKKKQYDKSLFPLLQALAKLQRSLRLAAA